MPGSELPLLTQGRQTAYRGPRNARTDTAGKTASVSPPDPGG